MSQYPSNSELPHLRRAAHDLAVDGVNHSEIARRLGVARSTVNRWLARYELDGESSFDLIVGPKGRLSADDLAKLPSELLKGPEAHGFDTPLWTLNRMGQMIEQVYGVRYTIAQVWRILKHLGWSCQKPERRAKERNEQAIASWVANDWPTLKKSR